MKLNAEMILKKAVDWGSTDIFIVAGNSITMRISGNIVTYQGEPGEEDETPLMPADTEAIIREIYEMAGGRDIERLLKTGDDDFSFAINGFSRFRMNAYRQRGTLAAVIRVISFDIPNAVDMHIPDSVIKLSEVQKGLVLVTGPAGSGKSTTLACIIDAINSSREANIITLEDPIEYLHKHKKSIISQREIHNDTENYLVGLRSTLRQSPDVILLGEMRDYEAISVAMTAAETGHALFSTLHTMGAANTINRIIDVFPADQQRQVSVMLSMVLTAIVSQQLVPTTDGGLMPAFEIMVNNPAISNLIRNGKAYQIDSVIAAEKESMMTMDNCLIEYYKKGIISMDTLKHYAVNVEMVLKKL